MTRFVIGIGSLLLLTACSSTPEEEVMPHLRQAHPGPTEHFLEDDAEESNREQREAWIEEMHRAAPGVDWRSVEKANAKGEMARREFLPRAAPTRRWSEVGSRNQAGRMMCAMLGPDQGGGLGRKLYAGSHLGGLWRANADGTDWEPLGDNLYGGVHELLVTSGANPGDPDIVLAASSTNDVYVTNDLGDTWFTPPGLENVTSVRAVGMIYGGAVDEMLVYGTNWVSGVGYRSSVLGSVDRGQTFQLRSYFDSNWSGWMWLPSDATASDSIYVLHRGSCYQSVDKGFSFSKIADIATTASAGVLAGSDSGGPHLYAALNVGGWQLHRSTNGGTGFSFANTLSDFWSVMMASPKNPDVVIYGGVEAWRSNDQGATFNQINTWGEYYGNPTSKLHADMMGFHAYWNPDDPTKTIMYFSTDGGLYRSLNQGNNVLNLSLSGLGVSQYYSTLSSTVNPDHIQAGAQDQGYQRGVLEECFGFGPSTDFDQIISGDYGHLTSSDGSHDVVFSTYPGFVLIMEGENNQTYLSKDFPVNADNLWLPPVVADPLDKNDYFFCGNKLWHAERSGNSWTYSEHSARNFGSGSGTYLTRLAFAPSDSNRAYAVNDAGTLYYSTDGAVTWTVSGSSAPPEHYFYGNALDVHPTNPLEAYVGGSGYSSAGVRRTIDGGVTWTAIDAGLPDTMIYDVAYNQDGSAVYAATEVGAYRLDSGFSSWTNIMESHTPITTYWSVEAVPHTTIMRFGTYGRGIWDYEAGEARRILFSVDKNTQINGLMVDDGDIVAYDCISDEVTTVVDLSDVMTDNVDVDALCLLDDGSFVMSFRTAATVDGLLGGPSGEQVKDEDLVRFVPTTTGENTTGTFHFYFDGSDVGLADWRHDIDALSIDANGDLHMSFLGRWTMQAGREEGEGLTLADPPGFQVVNPLTGSDEDVVAFHVNNLGKNTKGHFTMLLDASVPQIKLSGASEDIDAYHFNPADGTMLISTEGNYQVPTNQTGEAGDLLKFIPSVLGSNPAGIFFQDFESDLIKAGINIDAVHVD